MNAATRFTVLVVAQIAVIAIVLLAILYFMQERMIYPGAGSPAPVRMPIGFVTIPTRNGALHMHRGDPNLPVILHMHGNGGSVRDGVAGTREFIARGYTVAIVGYPGYDGTRGSPSEAAINAAATDAYDWLVGHGTNPDYMVVMGNSIGSGPAVRLAATHETGALVLVSGLADLPGVVVKAVPFAPRFLVHDRYDNKSLIRSVRSPILLLHAEDDAVVPVGDMGVLARASGPSTKTIPLPAGGHQIMFAPEVQRMIEAWVRKTIA